MPSDTNDSSIVALRDAFCALFFEYWSSYKYNSADEVSPADFYPDTLIFVPFDLDRKFHVTLHASPAMLENKKARPVGDAEGKVESMGQGT